MTIQSFCNTFILSGFQERTHKGDPITSGRYNATKFPPPKATMPLLPQATQLGTLLHPTETNSSCTLKLIADRTATLVENTQRT